MSLIVAESRLWNVKTVLFKNLKVKTASSFESREVHFGVDLLELLQSREGLMRDAFLHRKSHAKSLLK